MKPFRTLLLTAALTGALLTPAHAASLTHTVAKGETMWKIASKYQMGTSEILQANPQVSNPDLIYPGQVLSIPQLHETVAVLSRVMRKLVCRLWLNEVSRQ